MPVCSRCGEFVPEVNDDCICDSCVDEMEQEQ